MAFQNAVRKKAYHWKIHVLFTNNINTAYSSELLWF